MLDVSEAQAAAIRTAFHEGGEFSAAVELRRIFPTVTVTDNDKAREHVRIILGLPPPPPPLPEPPAPPCTVTRLPLPKGRPDA
jgi:hypothetical protein